MAGWNLADVLDVVAQTIPDRPALIQGPKILKWADLDSRANAVAAFLANNGLGRQDKVTQYLHNTNEYIESLIACFKGSFIPINTNYRYGPDELVYLWQNGDVSAVIFHGSYSGTIESMKGRVPGVKIWLWVNDGSDACPSWATAYEDVAERRIDVGDPPKWSRSGDDLIFLYTGGTTGMPKGVMWRQDDLFIRLNTERGDIYADEPDMEFVRARVSKKGRPHLSAGPLMHGAGLLTCFLVLSRGGAISHLQERSFSPVDLLDTIERDRVASLMWVGDAFARPTVDALNADPDRWDLTSLRTIMSSGVIFSADVKQAVLRHVPQVIISDVFGSSETMSLGRSVTSKDEQAGDTGSFRAKPNTRIIREDGHDVVPGSGERGLLAIGGRQPLGYYGDEAKTAATFRMIDGKRYAVPGDWATIDENGIVKLLGRGSECINTGGEKVFPEEVEAVLKRHEAIYDAVVVGIPHERFGQSIVAVVETRNKLKIDPEEVIAFVKKNLSGYKAPRSVVTVEKIDRGPNGKPDLNAIRKLSIANAAARRVAQAG
jgi:acyl-CoA synthetase (AMP-forming)/AMP-acid ligase II